MEDLFRAIKQWVQDERLQSAAQDLLREAVISFVQDRLPDALRWVRENWRTVYYEIREYFG